MLLKNVKQPTAITIGDVTIYLFKIGEKAAQVGIDAPSGKEIVIELVDKAKPGARR